MKQIFAASRGNFDKADFQEADLRGADLSMARFSQVHMRDTNLEDANLRGSILTGTRMMNANLCGADLRYAHFDEKTILPDAKFNLENKCFDKYWTPQTDMTRYTNPDHPDFWQPEWVRKHNQAKKDRGQE